MKRRAMVLMDGAALVAALAIVGSVAMQAAPSAQTSTPADVAPTPEVPVVRDPRNWPTPVMDTVPPTFPELRRGAVLVLSKTNGFRDGDQIAAAKAEIVALVRKQGRDVFTTENAAVMNPRDLAKFSVVVLNSTSGTIFDDSQRAAFRSWIEGGGGVVLLHGAGGDPHYDWSWYPDTLIGAQFIGHTARPKQFQMATIHVLDRTNPATRDLPAEWNRVEEWYSFDRVPTGNKTHILATVDESTYELAPQRQMGKVHPIVWTRCIGRGRMIFSALGHKAETYAEPLHQKLISGAVTWAAERGPCT